MEKVEAESFYEYGTHILLVNVCDVRHIMRSLGEESHFFKEKLNYTDYPEEETHIYIFENELEVLARYLLSLAVANCDLSDKQKAEVFLETFGNMFVTERIENLIDDYSKIFTRIITRDYEKSVKHLYDLFDLTELKYRDIDELEIVFRQWRKDVDYDMQNYYDHRLRGFFKERFDFRSGVINWDYEIYVKDEQKVKLIHWLHYKMFRLTGVAFETRMSEYKKPNRTLTSYALGKSRNRDSENYGCKVHVKGYWGDITLSPYYCFGIEASDPMEMEELQKTINMQQKYNSLDLSDFNLRKYLVYMRNYALIHFEQKTALTWKEKYEYEDEVKKAKQTQAEKEKQMEVIEEQEEQEEEKEGDNNKKNNVKPDSNEDKEAEKVVVPEDSVNNPYKPKEVKLKENKPIVPQPEDFKEEQNQNLHPEAKDEDEMDKMGYHYLKIDQKNKKAEKADAPQVHPQYNPKNDPGAVKNTNLLKAFSDRKVKFHFLRAKKTEFERTFNKKKYKGLFNRVVLGGGSYKMVEEYKQWTDLLSKDAHVWYEDYDYLSVLDKPSRKILSKHIRDHGDKQGLYEIPHSNILSKNGPHHVHFRFRKPTDPPYVQPEIEENLKDLENELLGKEVKSVAKVETVENQKDSQKEIEKIEEQNVNA